MLCEVAGLRAALKIPQIPPQPAQTPFLCCLSVSQLSLRPRNGGVCYRSPHFLVKWRLQNPYHPKQDQLEESRNEVVGDRKRR